MEAANKKRHGCLTAWLIAMIVLNAATALIYLVGGEVVRSAVPASASWIFPVLIVFAVFNVVCSVALFRWKKWGFWGFCVSSAVALAVNLSAGLGIGQCLLGLVGLLLLYGVLQIGQENKGWPQLE